MHQRVAQHVPLHDPALAHALAARGADEIGIEDLEHGGARGAGQQRQRRDAERDRGQDQVAQAAVAVAEARQPVRASARTGTSASGRARTAAATGPRRRRPSTRVSIRLPGFSAARKPSGTPTDDGEGHGGEAPASATARSGRPISCRSPARACGTRCRDRRLRELATYFAKRTWSGSSSPISLCMRSITAASMHVAAVLAHARGEAAREDAEQQEDQRDDREEGRDGCSEAPHEERRASDHSRS